MIRVREIIKVKYDMLICYQRHNLWFLKKWTVLLSFGKEKQLCCENYFYLFKEKQLVLWKLCLLFSQIMVLFCEYWWHHWWLPFRKRTVPLSFICVLGNGPMNSNSCLEFFLRLTKILTPTLYWWLFRRIFLRLLLWFIRNCLRCWMCSQSATCLMFKMAFCD